MRDWIIIIGTLLILVVLFDGIRRTRNARYGNIRMSPNMKKRDKRQQTEQEERDATAYTSELPNGGARVVGRRGEAHEPEQPKKTKRGPAREPQQASLNLGDAVPLLMEEISSVQVSTKPLTPEQRIEPRISAVEDAAADLDAPPDDEYEGEDFDPEDEAYLEELEHDRDYGRDVEDHSSDDLDEALDEESYDQDYEEDYDQDDEEPDELDEEIEDPDAELEDHEPLSKQSAGKSEPALKAPEEVLIINIMAHKGQMFTGGELLDAVLKCGMRFGDMDIFHRHADAKGEGALLFSMANMVKPGTFDLDTMEDFETPGVSLFMTLPLKADSMQSFDLMVDTAQHIAQTLDGELKDEQRSVMTRQTLEHCRQRILDFERRRLFQRPR